MFAVKAVTLIILWTVCIGIVYTSLCAVCAVIIAKNHLKGNKVDSIATYPIIIIYAVLAIVATLYPFIGFVADVSCGRFKIVISCFCLVLFSYLVTCICLVAVEILKEYYGKPRTPPAIAIIAIIATTLMFIGFGGFQANFIQLGLDQQLTAPSKDLFTGSCGLTVLEAQLLQQASNLMSV